MFTQVGLERRLAISPRWLGFPQDSQMAISGDTIIIGSMPRIYFQLLDLPPVLKRFRRGRHDRGR